MLNQEPLRFSTRDVPAHQRPRLIHQLRDRGILPIEPLAGRHVHVDVEKRFLPSLGILSGTLAGLRQDANTPSTSDDLFFGLNLAGGNTIVRRDREIAVGERDGFVLNGGDGAFSVLRPARTRFIGLRVPRKAVAPLVTGRAHEAVRVIPGTIESVRLLAGYVDALLRTRLAPEMSTIVASHVHDLLAVSIGATRDAVALVEERSLPAIRLRAIKSDILARLDDAGLNVSVVAARHHVTPRYVHRLFEREGITYTEFVLRHRLERAYRALQSPRFAHCSISSVAYDVGFGDLSYFNRAFRRRYGETPSDVRRRASRSH